MAPRQTTNDDTESHTAGPAGQCQQQGLPTVSLNTNTLVTPVADNTVVAQLLQVCTSVFDKHA